MHITNRSKKQLTKQLLQYHVKIKLKPIWQFFSHKMQGGPQMICRT